MAAWQNTNESVKSSRERVQEKMALVEFRELTVQRRTGKANRKKRKCRNSITRWRCEENLTSQVEE